MSCRPINRDGFDDFRGEQWTPLISGSILRGSAGEKMCSFSEHPKDFSIWSVA